MVAGFPRPAALLDFWWRDERSHNKIEREGRIGSLLHFFYLLLSMAYTALLL